MIKGMARLTTGGDIAKMLITLLFGVGVGMIVAAAMGPGAGRVCVQCLIAAVTAVIVVLTVVSVFQRYEQLSNGKCPNPLCAGVVQRSQLVGKGHVVCPTCKKTWPELEEIRFKATSAARF